MCIHLWCETIYCIFAIEYKYRETKGIVLKNNNSSEAVNINVWFVLDTESDVEFKIAFVALAKDQCGNFMEIIQNSQAIPYNATFYQPSESNPISIGNLQPGELIGMWITREVKSDVVSDTCDDVYQRHQDNIELPEEETTELIFDYS